ncbi:MAG: tyrosine-type recombinase/integrase [Bacteroidaceae bacterium]|nr:tyrosine-type recombinase/integrase [Bacteroidaceae bacterium]MBR1449518.1 tyrosine-type recombinase/integrase [Prevotella sp.]
MRKEIRNLSFEQNKKYRHAIDLGYFDAYDDNPREWKHTFVGTFLWKYPGRTKVISTFTAILGHLPLWEDMTDNTLRDLVDEMKQQGLASSSIRTMCAELKAVLNANFRSVPSDKDDFARILSVRKGASQAVYLTRAEMQQFINYKPASALEQYVHRNFIVEMLTGARLVDAQALTINNCNRSTKTLSYVPKKTPGIVVTVPIDERLRLRRFLADVTQRPTCQDVFNDVLRVICRNCQFRTLHTITRANKTVTDEKWKFISSHTARRSFATNLYLAGVTLEDIALMMGHGKNIETTKRYICAERKVSPAIMSYFLPQRDETITPAYIHGYNAALTEVTAIAIDHGLMTESDIAYRQIADLRKESPE